MRSAVLASSLSLLACGDSEGHCADVQVYPMGYGYLGLWVRIGPDYGDTPNGSVEQGRFTFDDVWARHARIMPDAVRNLADDSGYAESDIWPTARLLPYILVDNCVFIADDGRTMAAGQYHEGCRITAAYYKRMPGAQGGVPFDQVPPDAPPHTVKQNPDGSDSWRWGELNDGNFMEILSHELGHAVFGECYGHAACSERVGF